MNSKQQQQVFFTKPFEVANALKVSDIGLMTKALADLREQLVGAISIRIDPLEKGTKPLVEYVQSCTNCSDLDRLWSYQASNNVQSLECLVPDVIGLFIRLSTTPVIRSYGLNLVQTILQHHIKSIYRGISSPRIPQCQTTFKLLTAMTSFSQSAAQEVFSELNFQAEGFIKASRCRQLKKSNNPNRYIYDLRTNYVQFVLALLINGDAETKKKALAVKGLVYNVFVGIEKDAYQLIEEILSTTFEHVIMDHSIQRSAKAQFFSAFILEQIAKIYVRNESEKTGESESGLPADLVHHFLMSVCTVPDTGMCFRDAGWYPANTLSGRDVNESETKPAEKIQNRVLSRFITTLRPADDMRQQELLLRIMSACPELVQGYWQSKIMSFEPSLSTRWLANVTVLQKSIQLPMPSLHYGDTEIYPTTPPSVGTILENILPKSFGRSASSKGLQHSSPLVRYTTMVVLAVAFQKLHAVSRAMERVISTFCQSLDDNCPKEQQQEQKEASEMWKACLSSVRDELRRRVPEIQLLISLHSHVSSNSTEEDPESLTQRVMLQNVAFRLIRYYQEFIPEAMLEGGIDSSKFIPSDILSVRPGPLVHLLELLLSLPDFRWGGKAAGTSFSYITTLFTLYLQTPYNYVRELTSRLINQTLSESTMFQHDPEEIDIWLKALPRNHLSKNVSLSKDQTHILQFLDDCIARFGKAQYRYIDQLAKIVDTINKDRLNTHTNSSTKHFLQNLLGSVNDSSEYTQPFSPLLLTLVENLKFVKTSKRAIVDFITRMLVLLLKKQKVPFYLHNICATIDIDVRFEAIPCDATHWDETKMVQQAALCLDLTAEQSMDLDTEVHSVSEPRLEAILAQNHIDDVERGQKELLALLEAMPTSSINLHLKGVAEYCRDRLRWSMFDPLVSYMCQRHPLAGNLFDYTAIATELSGGVKSDVIAKLLGCIPFDTLLHNAWRHTRYPATLSVLKRSLDITSLDHLLHCINLVLEYLSSLLLTDSSNVIYGRLEMCLELLTCALKTERVEKDAHLRSILRRRIVEHHALEELNTRLLEQVHQLQDTASFSKRMDTKLLEYGTAFTDLFSEGLRVYALVENLSRVDYEALRLHCEKTGQMACYQSATKLLRALVGQLCSRHRQSGTGIQALPKDSLAIIAQQWRVDPSKELDADMLSLLENTSEEEGLSILLNICCEPLIESLLTGRDCKVDMDALKVACKGMSVDVSAIVIKHLENVALTSTAIGLVKLGYIMLDPCEDSTFGYIRRVFEYLLHQLTTMASSPVVASDVYEGLDTMMSIITGFSWPQLDTETVRDFVLAMIMHQLHNTRAIQLTGTLTKLVYQMHDKREPIETYLHKVLYHERYQELCSPPKGRTGEEAGNKDASDCRLPIISLIHILNEIQPMIIANRQSFLDPLLTSYGATTSSTDNLIFHIVMSCERHGRETVLPKMLLWGLDSDTLRQTRLQTGSLLRASSISTATFGLIDPALMKYTFTHFPFEASLETSDLSTPSAPIYDIRFFLPLFANIIASGAVDCHKFIECNALGLVVVSLSSTNDTVRKLAFQIMDQFYVMLEYANFRDKVRIAFLLTTLKNSVHEREALDSPPRIPAPITVCVSHGISIILHPTHHMLPHISKWITQSSSFDFQYFPMCAALLSSSSPNQRNERLWFLRVLSSSLGTYEDYKVFEKHRIWDMIAVIYNSALPDPASKKAIIEVLSQATKIPSVASNLVKHNGLFTWIHQVLALCPEREEARTWTDLLTAFIDSAKRDGAMADEMSPSLDDQCLSIQCADLF